MGGDEDWVKPQMAVTTCWNEVTPCNLPLARLAQSAKDGCPPARRVPAGIHHDRRLRPHLDGPRRHAASLVSREWIADSVELAPATK
jgi:dihydroxy-acid dehydratase